MQDSLLARLADHARDAPPPTATELATVRACLLDALALALRALRDPDCARLVGPVVPGATMTCGARVPGTSYELDPVHAAFNLGAMIRWCEPRDAARACHPADTLGALLAVADWRSRRALALAERPVPVRELLIAVHRAHRIHSALARGNGALPDAWDDAVYARVATAAVATALLGGTRAQVLSALSHAMLDGAGLRAAEPGGPSFPRDRWSIGDAASRGVRHALLALAGEPPCDPGRAAAAFGRAVLQRTLACEALAAPAPADPAADAAANAAGVPDLEAQHRLADAAATHFSPKQAAAIVAVCADSAKLDRLAVHEFVSVLVKN